LLGTQAVRNDIPDVLYKFLLPEHAERMVEAGLVRVGTLFEFRALEGDDPERGDSGEGSLLLHSDTGPRVYNSTAELPPVLRQMGIECGPGGLATKGENAFVIQSGAPNMLVYCVSDRFDRAGLGEWGGACVRISEPVRFFLALDGAVRSEMALRGRPLGQLQVGRCCYVDRRHNWHKAVPAPWLLKPARFEHQSELRAGWTVGDGRDVEALLVSSPEVAAVCGIAEGADLSGAT